MLLASPSLGYSAKSPPPQVKPVIELGSLPPGHPLHKMAQVSQTQRRATPSELDYLHLGWSILEGYCAVMSFHELHQW